MANQDKDIIEAWRTLVAKSGAKPPLPNLGVKRIYNSWCPDSTLDVVHLDQNRPDLKKILKQSLSGELRRDCYPKKIVNNDEFRVLWELVHGEFDPVAEADLKKFARYRLKGVRKEMWEGVDESTMGRLVTSYMKFHGVEVFVEQYKQKWKDWIEEQKKTIDQMEEFAKQNPREAPKDNSVWKEIKEGRETLTKARKEKASMPKFVDEAKRHLSQDIFEALRGKPKIAEMPSWAVKLDREFIEKSQAVYELILGSDIDDPDRVAQMALSFNEAEENQKIWADRMMDWADRMMEAYDRLAKARSFS